MRNSRAQNEKAEHQLQRTGDKEEKAEDSSETLVDKLVFLAFWREKNRILLTSSTLRC
jgi:hypothetical protein